MAPLFTPLIKKATETWETCCAIEVVMGQPPVPTSSSPAGLRLLPFCTAKGMLLSSYLGLILPVKVTFMPDGAPVIIYLIFYFFSLWPNFQIVLLKKKKIKKKGTKCEDLLEIMLEAS